MPYSFEFGHNGHAVLSRLLAQNAQWASDVDLAESGFFQQSAQGQAPKVLWIGCADSRVPESVVLAAKPGDIFVHRNVANQVHLHDDNVLSVIQYAVDAVGVEHIIIAGHTNCGGAAACHAAAQSNAASPAPSTPLGRWLEPLTTLAAKSLSEGETPQDAMLQLVEENIKAQVLNVAQTETLQNIWKKGKQVHVHGWLYHLENGRVKDLGISVGKENVR
ncbi:unnamed protein product [Somion occarium]|uniref:Carbonic anhydrase n=1 Tax=Somion occarium TaxID=3059160 RepID=A0ABP1CRL7_9APHY